MPLAGVSCADSKLGQNSFHCEDCGRTTCQESGHVIQEAGSFLPGIVFSLFVSDVFSFSSFGRGTLDGSIMVLK